MEPRIQYAKMSDGVNIAYAVLGDGPPIVYVGAGWGDINLYASGVMPFTRVTDALVGLGWRVIIYDGRGAGSSEHGTADFSLEGRLRDLETVIERRVPPEKLLREVEVQFLLRACVSDVPRLTRVR